MNFEQIFDTMNKRRSRRFKRAGPRCVIILKTVQEENLPKEKNKLICLKVVHLHLKCVFSETLFCCLRDKRGDHYTT